MSHCPTSRELLALIDASLEESSAEVLLEHLDSCPECLSRLEQLRGSHATDNTQIVDSGILVEESHRQAVSGAEARPPRVPERAAQVASLPLSPGEMIGRYRVERLLGEGGFGRVYLAYDEQLHRSVAAKVPHRNRIARPEDAEAYLTEARTVANLDHPGIVPVHDVGSTDDCACYIISRYVDGSDLATRLKQHRFPYREACELVVTVARALHYAHTHGLVHRDVKPSNILIGSDGRPYVVDFGLALREADVGKGPRYAGTPLYMSPEQARGEGHRVDGRSDIFSLGIVFYELLVGRKPFRGETAAELLEQVSTIEPRPLRQYDGRIPRELERICYKAMAKRAAERYATAEEFAEDLQYFLAEPIVFPGVTSLKEDRPSVPETMTSNAASGSSDVVIGSSGSYVLGTLHNPPGRIVPKGLRSFDAHDADFFLELLPGPRDRDGLPESLRFWKSRIEETDPDQTFSVGLIYGPSGCGKSSLVKAGLLPRLSEDVIPVYMEATSDDTETRLLQGLRKRCPALDESLNLKASLTALRRGQGIPAGKKLLLVLDQFEQWLHSHKQDENSELVQALRQCDGGRVQCIVMVRDDFWMAATRFMREMEVQLAESRNSAAVDLFPIRHAGKVLAAFGRAFGTLPENLSELNTDQKAFLKQAVAGLAEEGKVICVRLALFAEMMKGRTWTPATLKEVGGTKGVGVTFLEETFNGATAPPEHRRHQEAARAVLMALLPEGGTDIKGQMRSSSELLEASGCENRPGDFDDLIRILDAELRLITPTDPEGKDEGGRMKDEVTESADSSFIPHPSSFRYYQLTHDYLVHSLRDWLTRKQKETRRGRAELRLQDYSTTWNSKPENRFLPSWWENLSITFLTDRKHWTEPQRAMMSRAARVHGGRSAAVGALLAALLIGGMAIRNAVERRQQEMVAQKLEEKNAAEAARLVEGLLDAETFNVKRVIESLTPYRKWADDDLVARFKQSSTDSNTKLHAGLALLPVDNSVLPFLKIRLLTVAPAQFQYVRDLLDGHRSELISEYWPIAKDSRSDAGKRFQAACALATYDPGHTYWQDETFREFLAGHLVSVLPSQLESWRNALRPVKQHLTTPLATIYRNAATGEQARGFATVTLADYLSDDPRGLFDLLVDAGEQQFDPLFNSLDVHRVEAVALATTEVNRTPAADASEDEKEALAKQVANSAVLLLRMDAPEPVWPLLRLSPDPRVRSNIMHWLRPRGCPPQPLMTRYDHETDVTIKRALLLCLGEFDETQFTEHETATLIDSVLNAYKSDPDPGLHGAAEWLLRKRGVKLPELPAGEVPLTQEQARRRWYVNGQGQTYTILDAGQFVKGSPKTEPRRDPNEERHLRIINRRFAISTREVTREQWQRFADAQPNPVWSADNELVSSLMRSDDSPMLGVSWWDAAAYCNWLSEQEGMGEDRWCYERNSEGEYAHGMKAKDNFLELTGYRLPTESEWEFACRAGTETSRYYGLSETMLPEYAWYDVNSGGYAHPVGMLKPNDFGLFDMLGNATEWCYDLVTTFPPDSVQAQYDLPGTEPVVAKELRWHRGGGFGGQSFYHYPQHLRAASRGSHWPLYNAVYGGFRPARTYKVAD